MASPSSEPTSDPSTSLPVTSEPVIPPFKFKPKPSFVPHFASAVCEAPIPINIEFDSRNSKASPSEFDRSYWEVELMRRHPEIADVINRVDPVSRAATLAALFLPNRRLNPQENILALIMQHLKLLGLTQTASALEESFAFPITHPQGHSYSQLVHHIERGVFNANRFWCLLLPTPTYPTKPDEIRKQLAIQCSATLGVRGGSSKDNTQIDSERVEALEELEIDPVTHYPTKGTINQLVWAVASRYNAQFPPNFVDVFAMTYHGFMSSTQMLTKLQEAWAMFTLTGRCGNDKEELQFVKLVEKWIEISFFDFDAALLQNLMIWFSNIKTNKPSTQKRLQTALQKALEGKQNDQRVEVSLANLKIPENLFLGQFELTELDKQELARQITMLSGHYYYQITPKELLDCAWSKPAIRHRAPNVVGLTNRFNILGEWAQYSVLFAETIDERIRLYSFFSELAKTLWEMHNFLDAAAIATALNANAVFRLKFHQALLSPEVKKSIQDILDSMKSDNNFALLQKIQSDAQKQGEALPYIGVYLTQLTFFYDGNPDQLDGLVNFTKCVGVHSLIEKILSFKLKEFRFAIIEQIQEKLLQLTHHDESECYARSLVIEPNGISQEDFDRMHQEEQI